MFVLIIKELPGATETLSVTETSITVGDAVKRVGINPSGYSFRVNYDDANESTVVDSECTIYLTRSKGIKGNISI